MNPSIRGYTGFNRAVIMRGMTVFLKGVIEPRLLAILREASDTLASYIDSGCIPVYLGHLHDSTGSAVYADGRVVYFRPTTRIASKDGKSGFGGVNHYEIRGTEFLERTVADAASAFPKGIWFVVFSTVPYAYLIDEKGSPAGRGQGFFKLTREQAVTQILAGLKPIANGVSTKS